MLKESGLRFPRREAVVGWIGIMLIFVLLAGCGSREGLVGVYKVESSESGKLTEASFELKANGDGVWRASDQEVPFSWYMKGGELRVNTRGGGVLVCEVDNGTIRMELPGTGKMTFRKTQ